MELRNIDELIKEKFSVSYMNDTKWYNLIETLTDSLGQVYLNYKPVFSEEVKGYLFDSVDFKPFFLEPTLYKEIEWIKIPKIYENWVNDNNRKAGKKQFFQNLDKITTEINSLGEFEIESEIDFLCIFGYR